MSQNSWKGVSVQILKSLRGLSSIGLNPRQGAAPSGISLQCFSLVNCGPGSCRTPTPSCLGSAGPTTFWWRSLFFYSSSLESFCEWLKTGTGTGTLWTNVSWLMLSFHICVVFAGNWNWSLIVCFFFFFFSEWWYTFTLKLLMAKGESSVGWKSKLKMYV